MRDTSTMTFRKGGRKNMHVRIKLILPMHERRVQYSSATGEVCTCEVCTSSQQTAIQSTGLVIATIASGS
jgi:hypothetical protein